MDNEYLEFDFRVDRLEGKAEVLLYLKDENGVLSEVNYSQIKDKDFGFLGNDYIEGSIFYLPYKSSAIVLVIPEEDTSIHFTLIERDLYDASDTLFNWLYRCFFISSGIIVILLFIAIVLHYHRTHNKDKGNFTLKSILKICLLTKDLTSLKYRKYRNRQD